MKPCLALESRHFIKVIVLLHAKGLPGLGIEKIPDLAYPREIQTMTTSNINEVKS